MIYKLPNHPAPKQGAIQLNTTVGMTEDAADPSPLQFGAGLRPPRVFPVRTTRTITPWARWLVASPPLLGSPNGPFLFSSQMPLSTHSLARVFAELVSPPVGSGTADDEPTRAAEGGPFGREVHVSGSAELSAGPDRAKVTVYLRSRKGEAGAARGSVARRLDYVTQTVRQRGGISENDVTVTENFSRIDNAYKMEAEICIIFTDFGKMQDTCNHLVEKLDKSVIISSPHFYHTMEAVDTLRRQVCVSAVRSAQQKAQEVCQLFGHSLGKPLLIKEEEVKESEGHLEDHADNSSDLFSFQQKLQSATIHISSRVFAIFEIKGEKKRKKAALIKGN